MLEYIPYISLRSKFGTDRIPYGELLLTNEWKIFRDDIVKRDENKCQKCLSIGSEKIGNKYFRKLTEEEKNESYEAYLKAIEGYEDFKLKYANPTGTIDENPTILHVHHTYYIWNYLPWQYPNNDLITVCQQCHNDIHQTEKIIVYKDSSKQEQLTLTPCERCNGTGFLPQFHYFEDGICFACNGNRYQEFSQSFKH